MSEFVLAHSSVAALRKDVGPLGLWLASHAAVRQRTGFGVCSRRDRALIRQAGVEPRPRPHSAKATEAGTAETTKIGSVHDGPVAKPDAQKEHPHD